MKLKRKSGKSSLFFPNQQTMVPWVGATLQANFLIACVGKVGDYGHEEGRERDFCRVS